MTIALISEITSAAALIFSLLAFGYRIRSFTALPLPKDRSEPKGSVRAGIAYAFTLGMAPWAKESTQLHRLAYLRGVAFHAGIFTGLAALLLSPWLGAIPGVARQLLAVSTAMGAILGLAGLVARFSERNLRALSTPDDYAAVLVVSLFLATASLGLVFPVALPLFWTVSGIMLIYAPFSKIRHCIYYASSRSFFGRFVGRRGVLPHNQGTSSHEIAR